ncbi:large ribosomal subunit protein bL9m isoform 2-T2 [Anomaloglossus baeobatrachus]|uniref:large ribosomal subunit protein bL9m isoform X2 n=1 Tax=Anomaloglossus baeobatrachus TaxID=238106 RepID=UPI003F50266E
MLRTCSRLLSLRAPSVTQTRGTVIVERWWKIPLAKEGEEPYLHPRRHRIYRLLEDTKHSPKEKMQLILTQNVHQLGSRGDTVLVDKRRGRNKLLAQGLAVYASPENKEIFEEERKMQQAGELGGRKQTWTGEMLGVVAPAHAVKIPDEPITMFGEYWCEVTVNGLDTVRMPMDVVNYMSMRTKRYNHWLSKQANTAGSPAEGDVTTETPAEDNVATETPAEGNVCESPPEGSTSPKSTS